MNNMFLGDYAETESIFLNDLKSGSIDVNHRDGFNNTPFIIASYYGYRDVVVFLLGKSVDINGCDDSGATALWWACYLGQEEMVCLLLENSADINICNVDGIMPLHIAISNGNKNIVKRLIGNNLLELANYGDADSHLAHCLYEAKEIDYIFEEISLFIDINILLFLNKVYDKMLENKSIEESKLEKLSDFLKKSECFIRLGDLKSDLVEGELVKI